MKKIWLVIWIIACLMGCTACQASFHSAKEEPAALMESSQSDWVKILKEDCGITGFGRPYGTVKETLEKKDDLYRITFDIDEAVSQSLFDGYVKGVWNACVKANGGRVRNSRGYVYDYQQQAKRRQEPLSYYIWYYSINQVKFRVGIYPTNMEEDIPGGIVMKIERWK